MLQDFKEMAQIISWSVTVLIAITLPFAAFLIGLDKIACSNYEKITGRQTKYVICGSCFVQTESGWLTKDEYGKVIIAREGLTIKDK